MKRIGFALLVVMTMTGSAGAGKTEAPDWLATARKAPMPEMAANTAVVELIEERMVEVSRSETRARVREALKLLTLDGLKGTALVAPQSLRQEFKLVGGWIIRPDGSVTGFDRKAVVQVDADGSYTFTTSKLNVFHPREARVGDTIAWEYESRSKSESWTDGWTFGNRWPTLVSRFGIKLPAGWTQEHVIHNGPVVTPGTDDDGYLVWEMRGIAALDDEPMSPPMGDRRPGLVVSYRPQGDAVDARSFESWRSVGKWYAGLVAEQAVADESIRSTAAEITRGTDDKLDSIRAVTRFVQGVRYLNVATGRSTAEPHPAPLVLKNRFGDCEDKSVLMITLLDQIGVKAYPIQARTKDIGALVTEFPAPTMFNHAIVAIDAPEGTELPSTITADGLGRLVVFDPTDSVTGLGDLGASLQGTSAVLSHPEMGGLVTLPVLSPETSARDSDVEITLVPPDGITVKARVTYTGQYAAMKRWHYGEVRGDKRKEEIASVLTANFGRAEISRLDVAGVESPGDPIVVDMELTMRLPGRVAGPMTTMATQFLFGTRARILDESDRKTILRIDAGYRETQRLTVLLPEAWRALAPLPAIESTSAVGEYRVAASTEAGRVLVERELTVKPAEVPPAGYAAVRKFFDDVARGDSAMLGFEKGPS